MQFCKTSCLILEYTLLKICGAALLQIIDIFPSRVHSNSLLLVVGRLFLFWSVHRNG
jgi:hypothetical protein